jgi:hypothetical protein
VSGDAKGGVNYHLFCSIVDALTIFGIHVSSAFVNFCNILLNNFSCHVQLLVGLGCYNTMSTVEQLNVEQLEIEFYTSND